MSSDGGYWDRPAPYIRAGLNSRLLADRALEEALALAADIGYEGVVLDGEGGDLLGEAGHDAVERAAQQLLNYGMECVAISAAAGGFATLGDEACEEQLGRLDRFLSIAERLQCPLISLSPGGPAAPAAAREDHWLRAAHYLREACDMALGRRVDILLANEAGLSATVDGILQLVNMTDRPNIFVTYNPANLALMDRYYGIEAMERLSHVLLDVRVRDVARLGGDPDRERLIGDGDLDYHAIFGWLKQSSYQGYVSADCRVAADEATSADDLARHEYAAIRQLLEES